MEVTAQKGSGKLQQVITVGRHQLPSDAPEAFGGEDTGAEPHDQPAAALAACTTLTATMYVRRKGMPLEDVGVRITMVRRTAATGSSAASNTSERSVMRTAGA